MKILLDDVFDTHWIYVDRHQNTTMNIIVRTRLDRCFVTDQISSAMSALVTKHPCILAKVCEENSDDKKPQFYLEPIYDGNLSHHIEHITNDKLDTIMESLSEKRAHRFNMEEGELAHLQVWQDGTNSIFEFSCAHLVGDVAAVLILFSDFLNFMDSSIDGKIRVDTICERLTFDEKRYGWESVNSDVQSLPIPDKKQLQNELWSLKNYQYKRFHFPENKFKEIKNWLNKNNINAKATDVFYYVMENIKSKLYGNNFSFSVIHSFRHLLKQPEDITNINTSATFAKIEIPEDKYADAKIWLEAFYAARQTSITEEGVSGLAHFFRCLNQTMVGADEEYGRAILNTFIQLDVFAFNNFGSVDHYLDGIQNYKVIDIDIQDAVPVHEVRVFGFSGQLQINPMLDPADQLSVDEFWAEFTAGIDRLLEKPYTTVTVNDTSNQEFRIT